jgi:ATP-dependent DNA helicase RecG
MLELDDELIEVEGVGPKSFSVLKKRGLTTVADVLGYYPRDYEDYTNLNSISSLSPGKVSLKAKIVQVSSRYTRRRFHITEAVASDNSGSVKLVWFNQPYRKSGLKIGSYYFISGEFGFSYQSFSIMNPSVELYDKKLESSLKKQPIRPIYRSTKSLKSNEIYKIVRSIYRIGVNVEETLPGWVVDQNSLMSREDALMNIHLPSNKVLLEASKKRLGFEELFELILSGLLLKKESNKLKSPQFQFDQNYIRSIVSKLPFELTPDQKIVTWEILQDIEKQEPMNRLVEGDVGSGKTVVAAIASAMVIKHGHSVALMSPTEVLAVQHYKTINELIGKTSNFDFRIELLVGKTKQVDRNRILNSISDGEPILIVGTHALIQESVRFRKLGLAIIDEQHRFGVNQRKKLQDLSETFPHLLALSATPIPRTLALTLYGELEISLIKSKPVGRKEIKTEIVTDAARQEFYGRLASQIQQEGIQAFIVAPLIDGESSDDETNYRSVKSLSEELEGTAFTSLKVAVLHGKMKSEDKNATLKDFADKKYDVLISTTVIEVGVDVPNANIMVIEHAERFGLAQIHQLRGRVGRGDVAANCYLVTSADQVNNPRLRALCRSNDGFALAELDLSIRGPGAIYGAAQHGALDLKMAQLDDIKTIKAAREMAVEFIAKGESLVQYRSLDKKIKTLKTINQLN